MIRPRRLWLPAHALAMGFSLAHMFLDFGLGVILGPPDAITAEQMPTLFIILVITAGVYGLWASALVVAVQGNRWAMAATLPLCALGAVGNGLTVLYCLPPCGAIAPIGDLAHIGSLVFGVWALYESGRALRQPRVRISPVRPRGAQSTEATPAR
jgi:hypothetical protein